MVSRLVATLLQPEPMGVQAALFVSPGNPFTSLNGSMEKIWWTDDRIEKTVNRPFVLSRIQPELQRLLEEPLAFGQGLTDCTYMEYILRHSKRLFLMLLELGLADQIFSAIDSSWDDADLPLSMESVRRLPLIRNHDESLAKKMYQLQFSFLLREVDRQEVIDYGDEEVVPLDITSRRATATSLRKWHRVNLCQNPGFTLVQRSFPLRDKTSDNSLALDFKLDVETARMIEHIHIAPIWAAYTSKGRGHILTPFVCEHTLKSFLDQKTLPQLQRLSKDKRRKLLLEWMLCLVDAIVFLHRNGTCHSAIKPSNILIDANNAIAFSDIGTLDTFQRDKKPDTTETYIYAPPEAEIEPPMIFTGKGDASLGPLNRRMSIESKSSSGASVFSSEVGSLRSPVQSMALPEVPARSPARPEALSPGSTFQPNDFKLTRSPSLSSAFPRVPTRSPARLEIPSFARSSSSGESFGSTNRVSKSSQSSFPESVSCGSRSSKFSTTSARDLSPLSRSFTQLPNMDSPVMCSSPTSYSNLSPTSYSNFSPTSYSNFSPTSKANFSPIGGAFTDQPESPCHVSSKADVFSLGCIFTDILTLLMKERAADFTKHRTSKHPVAERSVSRLDPSFHANLDNVRSWLKQLRNHALRKDDTIYRGVPYLIDLIEAMLDPIPKFRPSAQNVRDRLMNILTVRSRIESLHCKHADDAPVPDLESLHLVDSKIESDDWPLQTKSKWLGKRGFRKLVVP